VDREKLDRACEWGILGLILGMLVYAPFALAQRGLWIWRSDWRHSAGTALWASASGPAILSNPLGAGLLDGPWLSWHFAIYCYRHSRVEYAARMDLLEILLYGAIFFAVLDNLTSRSGRRRSFSRWRESQSVFRFMRFINSLPGRNGFITFRNLPAIMAVPPAHTFVQTTFRASSNWCCPLALAFAVRAG